MLQTLIGLVLVLIAGLLLFAAFKPKQFRIERRTTIQAPAVRVQGFVDDFHQWTRWSPWEHLDPAMKRTLSGAPKGLGAVYAWEGNSKAGTGRMEIMGTVPASSVTIKLDFMKPIAASNTAQFDFTPQGSGTEVRWAMYGSQPFLPRLMSIFIDMDKLVGRDFERGLASLKQISEAQG